MVYLLQVPGTETVDHQKAVKAYARPAAGVEQPLPSDVRPPAVLLVSGSSFCSCAECMLRILTISNTQIFQFHD
jgi:hypothetical protein